MIPKLTDRVARATAHVASYEDGDVIVREGDVGPEMFVVQQGEVIVTCGSGDDEVEVEWLGPGGVFGEMAVLESLPRDATATARGPTRVLVLGQGALLARLRRDPSFGLELLHLLSGRVRRLNRRVADLEQHGSDGEWVA